MGNPKFGTITCDLFILLFIWLFINHGILWILGESMYKFNTLFITHGLCSLISISITKLILLAYVKKTNDLCQFFKVYQSLKSLKLMII